MFVNGTAPDKRIEGIQSRLKKGEDLSTDQQNRLIIHELAENKRLMAKSGFQGMLSQATTEELRQTSQILSNSQDVERLEWLKELVSLKGDSAFSNSIQGQIAGAKTSKLTDEQRNLEMVSEKIQKQMKLFQYSLERAKKGEFMDVRQEEILDGD